MEILEIVVKGLCVVCIIVGAALLMLYGPLGFRLDEDGLTKRDAKRLAWWREREALKHRH